jgi:hypothetical protein
MGMIDLFADMLTWEVGDREMTYRCGWPGGDVIVAAQPQRRFGP